MKIHVALPHQSLPKTYFETRYIVLRKPLGAPQGSERIDNDNEAIHAWIEQETKVVSVGRAALISEGEDGSVIDVGANSLCPGFAPLTRNYKTIEDKDETEISSDLRPAFQIRQMGTLEEYRGKGLASEILKALEINCQKMWNVKTGWLQARVEAVTFYENNGWACFGDEYYIENVGAHQNMWKKFES